MGKMALHVFDLTGDDHVSFNEFVTAARSKLGVRVSNARLRKLWRESLDPEGRGRVHYKELANALLPHLNDHVADMLVADNNIDDGGYRSGQVKHQFPAISSLSHSQSVVYFYPCDGAQMTTDPPSPAEADTTAKSATSRALSGGAIPSCSSAPDLKSAIRSARSSSVTAGPAEAPAAAPRSRLGSAAATATAMRDLAAIDTKVEMLVREQNELRGAVDALTAAVRELARASRG